MIDLPHLGQNGEARMVDVSGKEASARIAVAEGRIHMSEAALSAIAKSELAKGDAIATARIAGILAAKRTGDLIPLCHPLGLEAVTIEFDFEPGSIRVEATASITGKTGVEMEAMTACSIALLTLYDMGKSLDRAMRIEGIRLLAKSGGKSGDWRAPG